MKMVSWPATESRTARCSTRWLLLCLTAADPVRGDHAPAVAPRTQYP
jgi:hypothetical protein